MGLEKDNFSLIGTRNQGSRVLYFLLQAFKKYHFAKSQDNPHKNVNFQVKWVTSSCTCTYLALSGMLLHGASGISSRDKWESKPFRLTGVQPSVRVWLPPGVAGAGCSYPPHSSPSLPIDRLTRKQKGFAFVTFMMPEHAVAAFAALDGTSFQVSGPLLNQVLYWHQLWAQIMLMLSNHVSLLISAGFQRLLWAA